MDHQCPYLDYRRDGNGQSFDDERPFCEVVDAFVQPMRADICAGRHGLDHVAHCEFYREHEGLDPLEALDPMDNRRQRAGSGESDS